MAGKQMTRTDPKSATLCRALATCLAVAPSVVAPSAYAAEIPTLAIELNKLESFDKGCRAYVVVNNTGEAYQAVKLDLVLFQPDGVIARRFAVDLAPLKASKKTVKLFEIEGIACEKIASVLVNEVMECRADAGPVTDCFSRMSFSSVAGPGLNK
jgi:hypothetical protein